MRTLIGVFFALLLSGLYSVAVSPTAEAAACTGVTVRPQDAGRLQTIFGNHPEGQTFCFEPGIFRLTKGVRPRRQQQLIGSAGTVINGSHVLHPADAQQDGAGRHYWTGQTQYNKIDGRRDSCVDHRGAPIFPAEFPRNCYPEAIFVNGSTLLQHVDTLEKMGSGTWYFDYDNDRIYMSDTPSQFDLIETTSADGAFGGAGSNHAGVLIENMVIEKFANPRSFGAIGFRLGHSTYDWTIRFVEVRFNHGAGIRFGPGGTITNSKVHHNGQIGLLGSGVHESGTRTMRGPLTVRDTETHNNNTMGYRFGWEAGDAKFTRTKGMVYENNYSHDNFGSGAWWDNLNENATIRSNLVEGNAVRGLFYEYSLGGTRIYWNTVRNNGHGIDQTLNGAGNGAGILVSETSGTEVYGNLLRNNRHGIVLRTWDRFQGLGDVTNNFVHHNDVHASDSIYIAGVKDQLSEDSSLADPFAPESNNRFENNTYRTNRARAWTWSSGQESFQSWQRDGLDVAGVLLGAETTGSLPDGAIGYTPAHYGPRDTSAPPPTAPVITRQPTDQAVAEGEQADFAVEVEGTGPFDYQWFKINDAGDDFLLARSTTASHTTQRAQERDDGVRFRVQVTDAGGLVVHSRHARLTVRSSGGPPIVTSQPSNQQVNVGETASFSVEVRGEAPFAFQWFDVVVGGRDRLIQGATQRNYTSPSATPQDDETRFRVRVTNAAGRVSSHSAKLTVISL